MTRFTKIELSQALAARNTELEAARLRIAELEGDVSALQAQLGRERAHVEQLREAADSLVRDPVRQAPKPVYTRPVRQATPEQLAFREACAKAKAMAMATGRSVRVGA
jgi:predicted nuclease with TOPRIM domain